MACWRRRWTGVTGTPSSAWKSSMPDMVVACHPGPAACRATAATGHPCLPGRLALNPSAPQHHAHTIMPGPWWEARFEPRSYGFRPGRSCQDAIAAIFWTVAGRRTKRRWVLDADLTAAFDRVGHDHILDQLGTFPAKAAVAGWLKAGVIDKGRLAPTEQGTPQGGVASPLLFNIALHGMEQAAGAVYRWNPYREAYGAAPGTPLLVRYADDLIALCDSREQAQQVKTRLAEWLAPKGLAFNEDKTRIVSLDDGVDFLGFNIRRYGDKLLIKPSTAAIRCVRKRLAAEVKALRGANAAAVLRALNPIVRGWAAYYRSVVSTRRSTSWTATGGPCSTGGHCFATRTSRNGGSSTATSASSTRPGTTGGCSATATAVPTCTGSPGHRSSGTTWSKARRP